MRSDEDGRDPLSRAQDDYSFALCVISCAALLAAIVGWVLNIVWLAKIDGFSGLLVLRVFGIIFAPIGAILGYVFP